MIDVNIYLDRANRMLGGMVPEAGYITLALFGLIILAMLINWVAMEKAIAKTIEAMQGLTILTPGLFFMFLFVGTNGRGLTDIMVLTSLWVAMTLAPYVALILFKGVAETMNAPQDAKPKTERTTRD